MRYVVGKAIASEFPVELIRPVLDRSGMPQDTEHDREDRGLLRGAGAGAVGPAMQATTMKMRSTAGVAVAIPDSPPPAALNLSAPATALPLQDVGNAVTELSQAPRRTTRARCIRHPSAPPPVPEWMSDPHQRSRMTS